MKKLFLIINLLNLLVLPQTVFAQQLPEDLKQYDGNTVVILEEDFGGDVQLVPELQNKKLFRVVECAVDNKGKESDCFTYPRLQYSCPANDRGDAKFYCDRVGVIVGSNGIDILKVYIGTIYRWAASIVGIIAVLRIVIAGVQISVSQGAGQLEDGKNKIFQSLASIILLFLSGLLLWTINPNFFR